MPYSLACPRTITNGAAVAQRERGHERDGAELGTGEAFGGGLDARRLERERLGERPEQRRIGLEAVLVEVDRRAPPRAQHEVAVQERALGKPARELVGRHPPGPATASAS